MRSRSAAYHQSSLPRQVEFHSSGPLTPHCPLPILVLTADARRVPPVSEREAWCEAGEDMRKRSAIASLLVLAALVVSTVLPLQPAQVLAADEEEEVLEELTEEILECSTYEEIQQVLERYRQRLQSQADAAVSDKEMVRLNDQLNWVLEHFGHAMLSALVKDLEWFDCSELLCWSSSPMLRRLREDIYFKYFGCLHTTEGCDLWTQEDLDDALFYYRHELKKCYEDMLKNCDCDIEGLEDLWGDLMLNDLNPLEYDTRAALAGKIQHMLKECYEKRFKECDCDLDCLLELWSEVSDSVLDGEQSETEEASAQTDEAPDEVEAPGEPDQEADIGETAHALAEKILKKYQECLEQQVASMTSIGQMIGLLFDGETLQPKTVFWNRYAVSLAMLQRINQIYGLGINWDDPLLKECCDHLQFLRQLLLLIRQYEKEGRLEELPDHPMVRDPYTYCRTMMMQELTKDCDPEKFCQAVACTEVYKLSTREAIAGCLTNPREQAFLEALNARIEECFGYRIELSSLADFCTHWGEDAWQKYIRREGVQKQPGEEEQQQSEAEKAFAKLDKILDEVKPPPEPDEEPETTWEERLERFRKLNEEWRKEVEKEKEEREAAAEAAGTSEEEEDRGVPIPEKKPVDVSIMPAGEWATEEGAAVPIEFSTSIPRIDISAFIALTANTDATVSLAIPIKPAEASEGAEEQVIVSVKGTEMTITHQGAEASTSVPLVVQENGLYVETEPGASLYPISLLPGEIESGLELPPAQISLEPGDNGNPVYNACLDEGKKFFAVFVVPFRPQLTRQVVVAPSSGEVLRVEQPWWSFMVSKSKVPGSL